MCPLAQSGTRSSGIPENTLKNAKNAEDKYQKYWIYQMKNGDWRGYRDFLANKLLLLQFKIEKDLFSYIHLLFILI